MRSRRPDLTLFVLASAIAFAPLGYSAEMGQSGLVGHEVITEVVPAEADGWPMTIPVLPAEFAISHEPGVPAWYFQMEGLALKRDASRERSFAYVLTREWTLTDPGPPEVWSSQDFYTGVLGTQDLHFGFQGGGRALVGRTLGDCHAFEVCYFDLTDWSEMAAVRGAPLFHESRDPDVFVDLGLFSPFTDDPFHPIASPVVDYNDLIRIDHSSNLDNLEWNLRRWILADPCRLQTSVLVGGRYMNVGETFDYYSESTVADVSNSVTTDTDNSMIGVQLGAMFEFHVDPGWWIDCEIKGAIFNNSARQNTLYTYTQDPDGAPIVTDYAGGREDEITAFALDLKLTATVLVTPRFAVRGGYQALWLDGLALASENMSDDIDVLMAGPASLVEDGKVLYHGPHLGASWVW